MQRLYKKLRDYAASDYYPFHMPGHKRQKFDFINPYRIDITEIHFSEDYRNKGIVFTVTDEKLLSCTGGIVQGMSGSPIVQDGRIAAVVTHVFVNEPNRGYGVYAFWMYSVACGEN